MTTSVSRRRFVKIGAVGVAAVAAAIETRQAAADVPAALVGRWEATARSHGGIGQVFELQADGTLVHWFAAMVDGAYKLEGTRLVESFKDSATGKVSEIRFEGATLVQKDAQSGAEIRMTRQGAGGPPDAPIVGVWSFRHETGVTAFIMFTADGRMIFRLPIRADRGRWSVAGDSLTMGLKGSAMTRFRYEVQGDQLVLTSDQGRQERYTRAELLAYN